MMDPVEVMARGLAPIAWAHPTTPEGRNADWERGDSMRQATAALSALTAAGYAVVPVVPTGKMVAAGHERGDGFARSGDIGERIVTGGIECIWSAMLAAFSQRK
jgi:hypothetical protein